MEVKRGDVFQRVGQVSPGRSVFNLSYEKKFTCDMGSRPARARGLKPDVKPPTKVGGNVAPRTGAWIETSGMNTTGIRISKSRPARARGLKRSIYRIADILLKSRPARARGLKRSM